MSGYVIDASVAVKWLVAEPWSEQAVKLLETNVTRIAPELLFAEAGNALWSLCRRATISPEAYREAIDVLRAAPVSIPVPMPQLLASAGRLALDLAHPVYDCVYLALAVQEQYPVVTADMRFLETVRAHPYLGNRIVHVAEMA